MQYQHKSASTRSQRQRADALLAEATFEFLWLWDFPPINVRQGLRRLHVQRGDEWRFLRRVDRGRHSVFVGDEPILIDDFTPVDDLRSWVKLGRAVATGDWRTVLRLRRCWKLVNCVLLPVGLGKRSDVIWKIGCTLRDRRASPREVGVVLRASRCWIDKWGTEERHLQAELKRLYERDNS